MTLLRYSETLQRSLIDWSNTTDLIWLIGVNFSQQPLAINFAVSEDYNLNKTYEEKRKKYKPLAFVKKTMWRLKRVTILPVTTSVNGLVPEKTVENLKEMEMLNSTILWMQKAVILAIVAIIRCTVSL